MPIPFWLQTSPGNLMAVGSRVAPAPRSGVLNETGLPSDYQLTQQGIKLETSSLPLPETHGEIINTQQGGYVLTQQQVSDPLGGSYRIDTYQVNVGSQQLQSVGVDPGDFSPLAHPVESDYRSVVEGDVPLAAPVDQQAVANTVAPSLPEAGTFIVTASGAGQVDTGNGVDAPTFTAPSDAGDAPGALADAAAAVASAIADAYAAAAAGGGFSRDAGGW